MNGYMYNPEILTGSTFQVYRLYIEQLQIWTAWHWLWPWHVLYSYHAPAPLLQLCFSREYTPLSCNIVQDHKWNLVHQCMHTVCIEYYSMHLILFLAIIMYTCHTYYTYIISSDIDLYIGNREKVSCDRSCDYPMHSNLLKFTVQRYPTLIL